MKVLTAFNYQHFLLFQAAHLTSTFWSADALEFHRFHWKPPAYLEGSLDHGSIWGSSGITGFLAVDESIEILHHPHHCNHITVSQISKFAFVLGEDIGCWWMLDGPQDPTWQAGIQAVTSWISLTCRNLTKRDHVRGCELLGLERMQQHDSWPQWQDTCTTDQPWPQGLPVYHIPDQSEMIRTIFLRCQSANADNSWKFTAPSGLSGATLGVGPPRCRFSCRDCTWPRCPSSQLPQLAQPA